MAIATGLANIIAGNKKIVKGCKAIIKLNSSKLVAQQTDKSSEFVFRNECWNSGFWACLSNGFVCPVYFFKAANFMQSVFSYFQTIKKAYGSIAKQEQRVQKIFATASSSATSFSTSISALKNAVIDAYQQVAASFTDLAQIDNLFNSEMQKSSD